MEKSTAFILVLIGGLITLVAGLISLIGTSFLASTMSSLYPAGVATMIGTIGAAVGVWAIICGAVLTFGAFQIRGKKDTKNWKIIILIFSILSLITLQGYIIGPILGLIGSLSLKK